MLLSALRAYAEKNKELPDFHARQPVRFRIDLDAYGKFVSATAVSDPEQPKRGVEYVIPYMTRTSSDVPLPLDKGEYVLGIAPPKKENGPDLAPRAAERHRLYVALLEQAAAQTGLPGFSAQHAFVSAVDINAIDLPVGFDPTQFVAVYVDGLLPTADPIAERWWVSRQTGEGTASSAGGEELPGVCGVCGKPSAPVENVPVPIRGLTPIGGGGTMALISGKSPNQEVFERHGMPGATGASICLACGNATHQILNQLIEDDHHATALGKSMYVSWSTEEIPDVIDAIVNGESDEAVGQVLRSLLDGKIQPTLDSSRFFCVAFGANSSRVVVRSWSEVTLSDAFLNIRRWFGRIRMVGRDGTMAPYPGIFRLLASVAPPGQGSPLSRLNPGLPDSALAAALTGSALPPTLLAHALGRIRAELGDISPATAALVKACLTPATHPRPEDYMTGLDVTNTDSAYLCGRLLALLDDAARQATTRNNALVDRSYAAASTMPAVTFTRLLRLHRAHIDKLRRDRPGSAVRIDTAIAEILVGLDDFPRTLAVTNQARFALGLYHQQAASRAAAQRAKEQKALQQPRDEDATADEEDEQ